MAGVIATTHFAALRSAGLQMQGVLVTVMSDNCPQASAADKRQALAQQRTLVCAFCPLSYPWRCHLVIAQESRNNGYVLPDWHVEVDY